VFGAMFRLTKNVLVLWPFYTPMGGFYTTFKDGLVLPFEATYGFVVVLMLMGLAIAAGSMMLRREKALSAALVAECEHRGTVRQILEEAPVLRVAPPQVVRDRGEYVGAMVDLVKSSARPSASSG
jgi:hypothetical protein